MSRRSQQGRIVSYDELVKSDWEDMAKLSVIFNHDVVETHFESKPRWRWKQNDLMGLFHEDAPLMRSEGPPWIALEGSHCIDLNRLANLARLKKKVFSVEEYMKYYMQIGYSLCGYSECFNQNNAYEFGLPGRLDSDLTEKELQDNNGYAETVIQYMLRVHEGKILRI